MSNLRHALRRLWRRPVASLVAVGALACGLGATAAALTVVDSVLLRPLPIADPERVVYVVSTPIDRGGYYSVTYPRFAAWRRAESFAQLAALRRQTRALAGEGTHHRIAGTEVSAGYFAVLGVEPALGRFFDPDERGVVMLAHQLWRERFGSDPAVVGRTVRLDGEGYQVVGVMPAGIRSSFLGWGEVLTPLVIDETEAMTAPLRGLSVLGRLAEGSSLETARAEIETISARLAAEDPAMHHGWRAEMHPVRWWIVGSIETPLWLILGAAALVLAVACGTVANLLYAMTAERRSEVAVRQALGAGSGNLLRELLAEGWVLGGAGGLAGLGLAYAAVEILPAQLPRELPRFDEIALGWPTVAALALLALGAGLASSLWPAWAAIRSASLSSAAASRTVASRRGRRIRHGLLAAQTALATVAVVASGLLVQSLHRLRTVEAGFEPGNLLTLRVDLAAGGPSDTTARIALVRELLARLDAVPGVDHAAASGQRLPLTGHHGTFELFVEGQPRGPRPEVIVNAQMISPGYFEAMGIPLLEGRPFADDETWESAQAVAVNESFARRFWPNEQPLGRWVEWQNGDRGRVVAVVGDVRQIALHLDPAAELYLAWGTAPASQAVVLKTSVPHTSVLAAVRRQVEEVAPGSTVHSVAPGSALLARSLADRIFPARMLTWLAAVAQGLGLLGLYGVVLSSVARRGREIAVRVALGAWPARIVRMVVVSGLRPVLLGLAAGVALAAAATRLLTRQLYGLSATDPLTFAAAAALIVLSGAAVCALPARRATAIDPAEALRRT